jgi:CheY-like chemotaxis protein
MRTTSTLLVEDEYLIRMMLAEMVEELGHLNVAEAANMRRRCHWLRRGRSI